MEMASFWRRLQVNSLTSQKALEEVQRAGSKCRSSAGGGFLVFQGLRTGNVIFLSGEDNNRRCEGLGCLLLWTLIDPDCNTRGNSMQTVMVLLTLGHQ